jgi:hypothetical protein
MYASCAAVAATTAFTTPISRWSEPRTVSPAFTCTGPSAAGPTAARKSSTFSTALPMSGKFTSTAASYDGTFSDPMASARNVTS